jgi:hypothetical protein
MAGLILIALIVILLFYIVLSKNSKKAFFISVVIVGAYMLYVNYACSPSKKDMKAMKPMAEAIVKYGFPKTLEDTYSLPYKVIKQEDNTYIYHVDGREYEIWRNGGLIQITAKQRSGNGYARAWIRGVKVKYFLVHTRGICSTMRQ